MNLHCLPNAAALVLIAAALAVACSKTPPSETAAANAGTAVSANAGSFVTAEPVDTRIETTIDHPSSMPTLGESHKHTFSPLFSDLQINEIAQKLGVPDNTPVSVAVGEKYYWEGAGIYIADVDFYQDNIYVAGAACEVGTSNLARSIYNYTYEK